MSEEKGNWKSPEFSENAEKQIDAIRQSLQGRDEMNLGTANEPGKESEPIKLLNMANRELGEETAGRIYKLAMMLEPYMSPAPPTSETDRADPEGDPVLIMRLIKTNRCAISMVNELLDRIITRLSY